MIPHPNETILLCCHHLTFPLSSIRPSETFFLSRSTFFSWPPRYPLSWVCPTSRSSPSQSLVSAPPALLNMKRLFLGTRSWTFFSFFYLRNLIRAHGFKYYVWALKCVYPNLTSEIQTSQPLGSQLKCYLSAGGPSLVFFFFISAAC